MHIPPAANASAGRRPVHSRRPSEQDVVLPSVEREQVDLTSPRRHPTDQYLHSEPRPVGDYTTMPPKRRSFPYVPDDRDYTGPDHKRVRPTCFDEGMAHRAEHAHLSRPPPPPPSNHQSMESRTRPRAQPPQEYIDLTSSPHRPVTNGEHRYNVPHTIADSDSRRMSYVPVPTHQVPVRDERNQYQMHPGEPPRAFNTGSGVFAGRAPPVRDYVPLRAEQHHRPVDGTGVRYARSGLHYGGPDLH